ncbi:type I restriction-modification system M subunit [Candidatus Rickettsiella viridis]|uniref:Type I restriction-modification system M subunit n=1 Tax=Candidatus Rickettsiella viridis TaxID=676208 RepID=A0A2Z5UWJ5_9COXI|nr:hypothetical protein [Candidatus Rickettsiella viridis]BBB15445.1 type I restriction-modification system M subunit [Candidatus Rickettsiella viridis]
MGIPTTNPSLASFNHETELRPKLSKLLNILLNNHKIDDTIEALTADKAGYHKNLWDQITTKINLYKLIIYDKGTNFSLASNTTTAAGLEAANIIFFIPYIGSALSIPIKPMLYAMDRQRKLKRTKRKFFRLITDDKFLKIISTILSNTHQAEFLAQSGDPEKTRKFAEKIFREFWLCFKNKVRRDSPETEDTHKFKSFLEDFSLAAKKVYSKKNKWHMAILIAISLATLPMIGLIFLSPASLSFLPIALTTLTQKLALAGGLLIPSLHFIETAMLLGLKKIVDLHEVVANKINPKNKKSPKKEDTEPKPPIDLKKFWVDCLYHYHETLTDPLKQNFQASLDKILGTLEKEKPLAAAPTKAAMRKKPSLLKVKHRRSRAMKVKALSKITGGPAARKKTLFSHTPIKQPINPYSMTELFRSPSTKTIADASPEHPPTKYLVFVRC